MQKGIKSRLSIHRILIALKNNSSNYDDVLKDEINKNKFTQSDISLIQTTVLNSVRYNQYIKIILKEFITKKLNNDSYLLLLAAITQLIYLNFKEYAVTNSYVELSKNKTIKVFPGFVNAILKNIIKNKDRLKKTKIDINCFPKWFLNQINDLTTEQKNKIVKTQTEKPDLHLVFKDNFCLNNFLNHRLKNKKDIITSNNSLVVSEPTNINQLPRYKDGEWWVQDYSAMLPLHLSQDLKNKTAIDLCAAPGGKTFQSLILKNKLDIVEKNSYRSEILLKNLQRLKFNKNIIIKDALNIDNKKKYDFIIVDSPCSSVGTIRKNPEILFRESEININMYTSIQFKLLEKAVELTKNKSTIIYMVCSFLETETTKQIEIFLKNNSNFSIKKFTSKDNKNLIDDQGFIKTLPSELDNFVKIDGFFAARLIRND